MKKALVVPHLLIIICLSLSLSASTTTITYSGKVTTLESVPEELGSLMGHAFTASVSFDRNKGLYQDYETSIYQRYQYGSYSSDGFIFTVTIGDYLFSLESGTSDIVQADVGIVQELHRQHFGTRIVDQDTIADETFAFSLGYEDIDVWLLDNTFPFELFSELSLPTIDGDLSLEAAFSMNGGPGFPPTSPKISIYTATEYGSSEYWRIIGEISDLHIVTDPIIVNEPPFAEPGFYPIASTGDWIQLNGGQSSDDDTASLDLEYNWDFVSVPNGSIAILQNAETASPGFLADIGGNYIISLVVTDEEGLSSSLGTVIIHVRNPVTGGSIIGWGDNFFGNLDIPDGLENAIDIVTSPDLTTIALKSDGTVVSWGSGTIETPGNLDRLKAVSVEAHQALGLKFDGTLVAWPIELLGIPAELTNVVAISSGFAHSLALLDNGTVVAWGEDSKGATTVPDGLDTVIEISAGYDFSVALKSDGSVVAWGDNTYDQISIPEGLSNVTAISCGAYHTLALRGDGTVVGWGHETAMASPPVGLVDAIAIAGGYNHSMALRSDGSVITWGESPATGDSIPGGLANVFAISTGGTQEARLFYALVHPEKWSDYEIVNDAGDIYTGDWFGWLNISQAPFIWSYALNRMLYMTEPDPQSAGAWAYIYK